MEIKSEFFTIGSILPAFSPVTSSTAALSGTPMMVHDDGYSASQNGSPGYASTVGGSMSADSVRTPNYNTTYSHTNLINRSSHTKLTSHNTNAYGYNFSTTNYIISSIISIQYQNNFRLLFYEYQSVHPGIQLYMIIRCFPKLK